MSQRLFVPRSIRPTAAAVVEDVVVVYGHLVPLSSDTDLVEGIAVLIEDPRPDVGEHRDVGPTDVVEVQEGQLEGLVAQGEGALLPEAPGIAHVVDRLPVAGQSGEPELPVGTDGTGDEPLRVAPVGATDRLRLEVPVGVHPPQLEAGIADRGE